MHDGTTRQDYLSRGEIEHLTERKLRSKQIEWCRRNRVPFFLSANGNLRILRATVEARLGAVMPVPPRVEGPDFDFGALHRR